MHQESPPNYEYFNFENLLKKYLEHLDETEDKLNDMLLVVDKYQNAHNAVKTAGSAISGIGMAIVLGSVLISPFSINEAPAFYHTPGFTIPYIGVGGAAISFLGRLSYLTNYVDYRRTNALLKNILWIIRKKESFDDYLNYLFRNFGLLIEKLVESGFDRCIAILIAVKGITSGRIDITQGPNVRLINSIGKIFKSHGTEFTTCEKNSLTGNNNISEISLDFISNFFGSMLCTGTPFFKIIGFINSRLVKSFGLSSLFQDLRPKHLGLEIILETKQKVGEEKQILTDLLNIVEFSKRDTESVLHNMALHL